MKRTLHLLRTRSLPLAISGCVAFALAACGPKTNTADATRERQLQEMQAKLDALSAQSADLNRQLSDREAADADAKRAQLEKDQAAIDRERDQLAAQRQTLADATPLSQTVADRSEADDTDAEPVYQGKPANYDLFYTRLQDDGDWIDSEEYGYIWHPRVARDTRWRPYSDGRWVETDRGWTWDSRERFGWATYHYGRWVNLNNSGWCWVPGNEWAPAWVSWRSSDRYVGWAPLPPEASISRGNNITASLDVSYDTGPGSYNFVDTADFGEETYLGRVVAPDRNVTIINQTVNVTNITYNDRGVHNYGPDFDSVRRHSRRPVDRYQLDLNRNPQFDRDATVPRPRGDRLAIVAPVLVASDRGGNSNIRPVKVEKKIVKADRDNGWRGINPEQRRAVQADLEKKADRQVQEQQTQREQQRADEARKARAQQRQTPRPNATPARVAEQSTETQSGARATPAPGKNAAAGNRDSRTPGNRENDSSAPSRQGQQGQQGQRGPNDPQRATADRNDRRDQGEEGTVLPNRTTAKPSIPGRDSRSPAASTERPAARPGVTSSNVAEPTPDEALAAERRRLQVQRAQAAQQQQQAEQQAAQPGEQRKAAQQQAERANASRQQAAAQTRTATPAPEASPAAEEEPRREGRTSGDRNRSGQNQRPDKP